VIVIAKVAVGWNSADSSGAEVLPCFVTPSSCGGGAGEQIIFYLRLTELYSVIFSKTRLDGML